MLSDDAYRAAVIFMGESRIDISPDTLSRYSNSTTGWRRTPSCIIYPSSIEHIIALLRWAKNYHLKLHPLSTGKNWGYTDASPVEDGWVILQLSRMRQIVFNEGAGTLTIEPGVTQRQAADYLKSIKAPYWIDCTGAPGGTALIGNIMERGFGHSCAGDRFSSVINMDVVLGDGRLISLPYGSSQNSLSSEVYRYGAGPFLHGLFTQSNFGIVTKLSIKLIPIPEKFLPFVVFCRHKDGIYPLLKGAKYLKEQGVLRCVPHIANEMRIRSSMVDEKPPVGELLVPSRNPQFDSQSGAQQGVASRWVMTGCLYGTTRTVAAYKREVKRALNKRGVMVVFLYPQLISSLLPLVQRHHQNKLLAKLYHSLITSRAIIDIHSGTPVDIFLNGVYYGNPHHFSENDRHPARDGCGFIWISPILPASGDSVRKLLTSLETHFRKYGFDCFITLSLFDERTLAAVTNFLFDASDPVACEQARRCSREAVLLVKDLGFWPYRYANTHFDIMEDADKTFTELSQAIKQALDPDQIISPGKYGI